jgi:hypothetical protein
MYRVLKEKGYSGNVAVENTETHAYANIGKLSPAIMAILRKQGFKFSDEDPDATDFNAEWCLAVNKETAEELVHLALNIKKPIRDQRKKPEEKTKGKVGVDIDAFDLIYGI